MNIELKKELHEAAVNMMFNVCESARLEDGSLFPLFMSSLTDHMARHTLDEIKCGTDIMVQMVTIIRAPQNSDLDHRRFRSTMEDVESFKYLKGMNVLTGIFQDVLGDSFVEEVIPDFATEPEVRTAMRAMGAYTLAGACDMAALKP